MPATPPSLVELLSFLGDWLDGHDAELLASSPHRFVGAAGHDLATPRADLACFGFLLGADGERVFGAANRG